MSKVLVVDDDDLVRMTVRLVLQHNGYQVDEATDGNAGFRAMRDTEYDLVITDIIMPEMNGRELARQLTAIHPEMSALYISGYTDRAEAGGTTIDSDMNFLQKPFRLDVLGRRLRDILEH